MFDVSEFHRIKHGKLVSEVYYFSELDSTNNLAEKLAKENSPEGTVVIANKQTQGIGRKGSNWYSPEDENLYFSIILRPEQSRLHYLPFCAGMAVINTLARHDIKSELKWPNDVMVSDKKICGILIHTSIEANLLQYAILGCGINVNATEFPVEFKDLATSLAMQKGHFVSREAILASFLLEFEMLYGSISDALWSDFCTELEKHSSYLRGCEVILQENGVLTTGITQGLDAFGGLIVRTGRERKVFYAGEIQICRKK